MKQRCRAALALTLLLSLLGGCAPASKPVGQKDEVRPEDIQLAEQLLAETDLEPTERDVSKVANDLRRLDGTFWREVVKLDGKPIGTNDPAYVISYENGVTETLRSTEDGSGPTNVIITSGEITDTWVYRSSGQIMFNTLSMRTHSRDTESDGSVRLRPIPADLLNQSPQGHEDLMTDPAFQCPAQKGTVVNFLPQMKKAGEVTFSSRLNLLAVSAAESILEKGCQASGAEVAAAVSAALAENKDLASQHLTEAAEGPSYMLFRYESEDAAAYVIDTYSSPYIYGDHFVWGILEER